MALSVKIISEEKIKPSSPTPETQKHLKFSFLDQLALPVYVPVLLFYSPGGDHNQTSKSRRLKASLSKALAQYYPFAGRVQDNNVSIHCNDEGAIYVEAQVNCRLSNVLNQLNVDSLNQFLPFSVASSDSAKGCILLVQTTSFQCGGITIGLLMSHKITDASSISSFINTWTTIAVAGDDSNATISQLPLPEFIGDSVLQPPQDFQVATPTSDTGIHAKGVTKRLVFEGSKITALKAKAASARVEQPTRVEAVAGLIWKCAIAASKSTSGVSKASVLGQAVNLRKRLEPNLSDTSIGNLLGFITPETKAGAAEIELQEVVGLLREGIAEFKKSGYKKYQDTEAYLEFFKTMTDPDGPYSSNKNFYLCSSWSRFGFYETDFGWGCPVWFIGGLSMFSNFFLLMDTRDGRGIEALVTLSEQDMALFQSDEDLLAFASFNPDVIQVADSKGSSTVCEGKSTSEVAVGSDVQVPSV
ncbi:BAHD acyltransferase, partial [Cucurbita argyrosperma subsp. argyrosperma]